MQGLFTSTPVQDAHPPLHDCRAHHMQTFPQRKVSPIFRVFRIGAAIPVFDLCLDLLTSLWDRPLPGNTEHCCA